MKTIITTASEADFFKRGKDLARLADRGQPIPEERIISFEDPVEVGKIMTAGKLAVFRAIKEHPSSITRLAERLHRDRSAVKRDVDDLEKIGLVVVQSKTLPGHGLMKEVSVTANHFKLEAYL